MTQLEIDEARAMAYAAQRLVAVAGVGLSAAVTAIGATMMAMAAEAQQEGLRSAAAFDPQAHLDALAPLPELNRAGRRAQAKAERRRR